MVKTVIVTGGGSGIGKALCHFFADKGCDVCAADISEKDAQKTVEEIIQKSPRSIAAGVDIRNAGEVKKVIRLFVERFKRLDALVNNAGVTDKEHRLINDVPYKTWDEIISVNLGGSFTCLKECHKVMKEQGGGNIVNITSLLGQKGFKWAGNTAYGVSKAALEALTVYAADEFTESMVNVNSVYPGVMVNTGFFDNLDDYEREKLADPSILNELVYVLCCLKPAELSGGSFCVKNWKQNPDLKRLYRKYLLNKNQDVNE
jgi:3-oxoacyl-[acyl-carrier protein] reductase